MGRQWGRAIPDENGRTQLTAKIKVECREKLAVLKALYGNLNQSEMLELMINYFTEHRPKITVTLGGSAEPKNRIEEEQWPEEPPAKRRRR